MQMYLYIHILCICVYTYIYIYIYIYMYIHTHMIGLSFQWAHSPISGSGRACGLLLHQGGNQPSLTQQDLVDLGRQSCRKIRLFLRKISLLRFSLLGFPMDMRIPPLKIKILLEPNPLKSRILVQRLAIHSCLRSRSLRLFVWGQRGCFQTDTVNT